MRVPIYREAVVIPKGTSSERPLYCYSFEPIGDLGPWQWIDAPDDARLERGRDDFEEFDGVPSLEDISDLRLVLSDGIRFPAVSAYELFGASGPHVPEPN